MHRQDFAYYFGVSEVFFCFTDKLSVIVVPIGYGTILCVLRELPMQTPAVRDILDKIQPGLQIYPIVKNRCRKGHRKT